MASNINNNDGGILGDLPQITNNEIEDVLNNFGLDFDAMGDMGGALPDIDINLDEMGSLGTRSPSPSGSGSVFSKTSSKRSRAEFDSESECDSSRQDGSNKRMVFQTGYDMSRSGSGLYLDHEAPNYNRDGDENNMLALQQKGSSQGQGQVPNSPTKTIRKDREREGRCPECGLDTHRIVMNDDGFELQPLFVEGEVYNGRCLLCNPLKEGETLDSKKQAQVPAAPTGKKGGRKKNGEASKKKQGRKSEIDNGPGPESFNNSFQEKANNLKPPSRAITSIGSINMSPPPHQQHRQSMMRNMQHVSPGSNNLPFPPPNRENRDSGVATGNRRQGKFTPTPNQYHSKMALLKQAQHPRKHSAMQHATLAFGSNSNNKRPANAGRNQNTNRRSSAGSGRPPPPLGGNWAHNPSSDRHHSSNASLSSVSCSEVEGGSNHLMPHILGNNTHNDDDNYSKASGYSQSSGMGGGLGKAMAMGMGMHCAETMSATGGMDHPGSNNLNSNNMPAQLQRSNTRSKSPHGPVTPHNQQRRSPLDPPLSRQGSSMLTPQSVPVNMSNMMQAPSSRMSQTPQSVPPNLSNMMSSRMGSGGQGGGSNVGSNLQPSQSSSKLHDSNNASNNGENNNFNGGIPQAVRVAHSKLQSSIYHHHIFPMNEETERAHAEKTLVYLESGSGDICDIIVAMRRFPFNLAIQRVSCEKLYAHCFDQEHAHAIGLVGGIRTIIDAMEHHPEDVALQRGCAGVIKHLSGASTYNLEMLDRMGAVAIIVSTMDRHSQNAPLLESCCWAMESMSQSTNAELKMRIAKVGGIHAAMKSVETFPNNESLLRAAFHCLRQLGYNPSNYGALQNKALGGVQGGGQQQGQGQGQQGHAQGQGQSQQAGRAQRRQHGPNSKQQQQQPQVPSFVSHRAGMGGNHSRGGSGGMARGGGGGMGDGGGMMMPNNMQNLPNMPNMQHMQNMMGVGNNNPMMGNTSPMMGNNNSMMGGNMGGGNNNINNNNRRK